MIFVIEKWSDQRKAWIPTGNIRRTHKNAVALLKSLADLPGERQIGKYERCREQTKARSDGKKIA